MTDTLDARPDSVSGWTGWRDFTIAEMHPESAVITSFILRPVDGGPVAMHQPGQHLTFLFPVTGKGEVKRNYTISCDANGEYYRISVKREPQGTVSRWLHDEAVPGTRIKVMPPSGSFVLPENQKRPVVFLSGGVGQTPMVAMTEAIADRHPGLKAQFIHCAIDGAVHAFRDHIRDLARSHGGIELKTFYDKPRHGDVEGRDYHHAGRASMDWLRAHTPIAEADYFVCGPLPFMKAFVSGLAQAGVETGRLHYEFFGPVEDLFEGVAPGAAPAAAPAVAARPATAATGDLHKPEVIGSALVGSASDAVIACDREGFITLWNPGAERIFGFTPEEAVGQSLDIIIPEPFRARHWEGYEQTVASGQSRYGAGDLLAVPGLRKDGTRNSIEFTIVLIKDEAGSVIGMVSAVRDVTKKFEEMKALKKQIAEAGAK